MHNRVLKTNSFSYSSFSQVTMLHFTGQTSIPNKGWIAKKSKLMFFWLGFSVRLPDLSHAVFKQYQSTKNHTLKETKGAWIKVRTVVKRSTKRALEGVATWSIFLLFGKVDNLKRNFKSQISRGFTQNATWFNQICSSQPSFLRNLQAASKEKNESRVFFCCKKQCKHYMTNIRKDF